jgi:hypothetical protein
VHEAIWSRAVQLGPGKARSRSTQPRNTTPEVCDSKIVEMIYDYQIANLQTNFASSSGLWSGLRISIREREEPADRHGEVLREGLLMARTRPSNKEGRVHRRRQVETTVGRHQAVAQPHSEGPARLPRSRRRVSDKRYNEPDTSRVARGVITGTPTEKKRTNVVPKLQCWGDDDVRADHPVQREVPAQPRDRDAESGHLIEYDDTPGYERIHIFHKSGTFIEIHPDGKMVHKTPSSNHTIVADRNDLIVLAEQQPPRRGDENATCRGP